MLPIDVVGVKPGVYKHYKGNSYRVLFTAEWFTRDMPDEDALVAVYAEANSDQSVSLRVRLREKDNPGFYGGAGLFDARWSSNSTTVYLGTLVVIYIALYGDGRVSARTVEEFEEQVQQPGDTFKRPRFEWVGP